MSGLTAPWFLQVFFDPNTGKPLSGGKVYFFVAGSTVIPKDIYADYPLANPLPNPLVLDAAGTAPEYYMEPGLYKIVVTRADGNLSSPVATRDNVAGVGVGTGSSTDTYTVTTTAADGAPDYLANKLTAGPTLTWTPVQTGANIVLRADVVPSAILDGKVKVNAGDTPGYLGSKIEQGTGLLVSDTGPTVQVGVNTTWLAAWLASSGYKALPAVQPYRLWVSDAAGDLTSYASLAYDGTNLTAAKLTTPNISLLDLMRAESDTARLDVAADQMSMIDQIGGVPSGITSWMLNLNGLKAQSPYGTWAVITDRVGRNGQFPGRVQFSAILDEGGTQAYITDDDKLLYDGSKLTVPGLVIDGLGEGVLSVDIDGNVTAGTGSNKVAVDALDTIPGFLATKIVAGTGIRFTTTSDGVNGKIIHVSATAAGGGANGYRARELTFAQRESHPVNTAFNAISLDIPAGTWDITAMGCYNCGVGSGSYAQLFAAISTVSATLTDDAYQGFSSPCPYMAANPGFTQSVTLAPKRMTFAVDTTIYLVLQHWGSIASGGESWGHITARQVIV